MRFVDTNIFLRYLVPGDPAKAQACYALFKRIEAGEEIVTTSEAVIAEVTYVLRSRAHYGLAQTEISDLLRPLLTLNGLRILEKELYSRALDLYGSHSFLDFEDALGIAHVERENLSDIISYDTGFDRIPRITRTEP